MAKLAHISIQGFKSIAKLEALELRPINLLIGANGAGKSNFLEVFNLLTACGRRELRQYVARAGSSERILHFGERATPRLTLNLDFADENAAYSLALDATLNGGLFPVNEFIRVGDKTKYMVGGSGKNAEMMHFNEPELAWAAGQAGRAAPETEALLGSWRFFHFLDTGPYSPMKKPGQINDNEYLRWNGANLAAFLHRLKAKHPAEYDLIRDTIQQVAPFFKDFRLQPDRLNEDYIRLEWDQVGSDAQFDATALSDGTLRFMALATLLLQPAELRPGIILLDEPELGLHPQAITLLSGIIKMAAAKSQLIVATQSPLLVDQFDPEDVLVANRVAGATTITRLDGTRLKVWLEDYSLGQLWLKNEFAGQPERE